MYTASVNYICIALGVVMMTTFVTQSNADIKPGDIVTIVESDAKLMVGNNVVAELPTGTSIEVTKIQDDWIAGRVSLNGQEREGWIEQDRVESVPMEVITLTVVERYHDAPQRWRLVAKDERIARVNEIRPEGLRAERDEIPPPLELSPKVGVWMPTRGDPMLADHLQTPESHASRVLSWCGEVVALPNALGTEQGALEPAAERRESGKSRHKEKPNVSTKVESEAGDPSATQDVHLSTASAFRRIEIPPISHIAVGDAEYWPFTLDEAIRTALANARPDVDLASTELNITLLNRISEVENLYWELYFAYRHCDVQTRFRDATLGIWRVLAQNVGRIGAEDDKIAWAREQYYEASAGVVQAKCHLLTTQRRLRSRMGLPINDDRLLRPADEPSLAKVDFDWNAFSKEALANQYSSEPRLQYLPAERRKQLERHLIHHLSEAVSKVARISVLVKFSLDRRHAALERTEVLEVQFRDVGILVISLTLDAQRQLLVAESDFFRHLAEYSTSIKDVYLVAGCLPHYHSLDVAGTGSRITEAQEAEGPGAPSVEGPVRKDASNRE